MSKTVTKAALAAVCAFGVGVAALPLGIAANVNTVFADTATVVQQEDVGTSDNPYVVNMGANTIDYMWVTDDNEVQAKELTYYMSFTPATSGVYGFAHSNPDIGIGQINAGNENPDGEWNDDNTLFTATLNADVNYTIVVYNYDWLINLDEYEVGEKYALSAPVDITVSYVSAAAGSTSETAILYTVGDIIEVNAGNAPVWYKFDANGSYYLISYGGTVEARRVIRGTLQTFVSATAGSAEFEWTDEANPTIYLLVTPTAAEDARVLVLDKSAQTEGSCIATAAAVPEDKIVGDGTWYTYTVGAENEKLSLTPTKYAPEVYNEGSEKFEKLCGTIDVYDGYTLIGTLYDGVFIPVVIDGTVYTDVTLEAGKTYHFFAPKYVYSVSDESGNVTFRVDIYSQLVFVNA